MTVYVVYTNLNTPVVVGKFPTRKAAGDWCKRNRNMFESLFIKTEFIK